MITGGGCFVALNLIVWAVIGHPYLDQVYLYHLGKTAGTGDHFTVFHAVFSANTWIVGGAGLGAIALLLGVDPGNEARSDEETADEAGSLGRLRDLIDQRLPLYLHLGAAIGSMLFLATAPRIFVHYFQIALVCLSPLAGFGLVAFGKSLREASTRRSSQALFTAATLSLVFLSLQLPILNLHHVDEAERIAHAWRGSGVPVLDSVVRSLFWRDEEVPGKRMLGWTRYLWIEADVFESAVPLSREVVAHCGPNTTLFGDSTSAPLIALLAKRRLVLDLADTNHMRFKGSDASIDSLLAQIEEAPPCAVLERTDHGLFTLPGFRRWLEKHHEPVFRVQDAHGERSYTLHVRKT
jgi:hypothetical protein